MRRNLDLPTVARRRPAHVAPVLLALSLAPGGAVLSVPPGAQAASSAGPRAAPGPPLTPPVDGGLARAFAVAPDRFAAGQHRGADLHAAAGSRVRAACAGRVAFAGAAGPSGQVVTVRCGAWRVTHLPLAELSVHAGARVRSGAPIGIVARGHAGGSTARGHEGGPTARGHAGLHLGVRRAGDPFGYVDPAPLLFRAPQPSMPPAGPRPARPPAGPRPAPPPAIAPPPVGSRAPVRTGSSPVQVAAGEPVRVVPTPRPRDGVAPWPVWAGLALLLAGAAGAGVGVPRRRRASLPATVPQEVR